MERRINSKEINKGDLMALVTFVEVNNKIGSDRITVKNVDNGTEFDVIGKDLIEQMYSADQAQTGVEVTKTQLAEKLVSSYNLPFTVTFEKADKSERTLRGRLVSAEPLLGRSHVEDLDIPRDQHRLRLVDHRTLKSLTVNGVIYRLKK